MDNGSNEKEDSTLLAKDMCLFHRLWSWAIIVNNVSAQSEGLGKWTKGARALFKKHGRHEADEQLNMGIRDTQWCALCVLTDQSNIIK